MDFSGTGAPTTASPASPAPSRERSGVGPGSLGWGSRTMPAERRVLRYLGALVSDHRPCADLVPADVFVCGVLGGVGAVLRVFQDVGSGRRPAQGLAGLLAGETLVDRQTHAPAAASGVHLHKRQGLGSAPGAHKSADRRR